MKASAICPICGKEVIEECEACIKGEIMVHFHKWTKKGRQGFPAIMRGVKWNIIS